MPWSIFDQPNGDLVATEWASLMLTALGAPTTPANITMVYQWEKTEGGGGAFNPLNQGPVPGDPSLTTTGQQYGGGAADFANWADGIEGAVAYLNMPAYAQVKAALMAGNGPAAAQALWQSPWASSHYGYGANWNGDAPPAASPQALNEAATAAGMAGVIGSNPATLRAAGAAGAGAAAANTGGGTVNSTAGNTVQGLPLTPADLPKIIAWIQQNWASYAWLLNESVAPGVAQVLEQAAVQGLSPDQVQAKIQQTQWWRTASAAVRQYEEDKATNPADYQFGTPGSKASQMYSQIAAATAGFGVQLTPSQIQELATQALQFGWTTQQIQQAIGRDAVGFNAGHTNAGQVVQQLNTVANSYFQTLSPQTEDLWTQQIAGGTRTIQEFQAQMAQQAAMKWTGYSQQLLNGYTMSQLTDNLRQEAAKTMEIDPNSINFTTNPTYQKIIDFAPPTPAGAAQMPQHRVMTLSEMDQYLKGLPAWGSTQQARDSAAGLEQTLLQNLGKVTG